MILLNDLFSYKPLPDLTSFDDFEENDEYYLNLLKTASSEKYYNHGLYFIHKFQTNKLEIKTINLKNICINIAIEEFIKNPKWYTYDILKYFLLDIEFNELYDICNDHPLLSMMIGEYLLRNDTVKIMQKINFPFYVSLPFYFYEKDFNFDIFDISMVFTFNRYIFTDNVSYRLQYYLEKWEDVIKIDDYQLKTQKLTTDGIIMNNDLGNNPYNQYLLYISHLVTLPVKSLELMILLYDNPDFILEGNVYTEIIKKHNHLLRSYNFVGDINFNIYNDILEKYRIVDLDIPCVLVKRSNKFRDACIEYTFDCLLERCEYFQIEFLFDLKENFFNIFLLHDKLYKYTWNGQEINDDIIYLIREYHTSKLMPKRFLEGLYKRLLDHEHKDISLLYLSTRNQTHCYLQPESSRCPCDVNFTDKINCMCKHFTKPHYIESNKTDVIDDTKIKKIDINIIKPKRYKAIIHRPIRETEVYYKKINISSYMRKKSYRKIIRKFIIFTKYFNYKYKSTNYRFIKYLTDENAKKAVSDLIKYDVKRLLKLSKNGFRLEKVYFLELCDRLKKEGNLDSIKCIGNILSYNEEYKIDILIYEELDFYSRNILLDLLLHNNKIVYNKSDLIKILLILNNEDNIKLVLKILDFIKSNIKSFSRHLNILERYRNNIKYNRLIVRIYPLWKERDTFYYEVCSLYKYKDEINLLNNYYQ